MSNCCQILVIIFKKNHKSLNQSFNRKCNLTTQRELRVTWDVDLYGELLKIGGGKERYHFSYF